MGLRPLPPRSTPAAGGRVRGTATRRPVPPPPVRPRPPPSMRSIGRRTGGPATRPAPPPVRPRPPPGGGATVRGLPPVRPPPAVGGRAGARRGCATRRPWPPPVRGGALTRGAPPVRPPPAVGGLAGARRRCASALAAGGLATLRGGAVWRGVRAVVRGELAVRPPVAAGGRAGARRAGARWDTAGARRAGVRWRTGGLTDRGAFAVRPPSPPRARARARCGSANATSGTPTAAIPRTMLASNIALRIALRMMNSLHAPAPPRGRSPFYEASRVPASRMKLLVTKLPSRNRPGRRQHPTCMSAPGPRTARPAGHGVGRRGPREWPAGVWGAAPSEKMQRSPM